MNTKSTISFPDACMGRTESGYHRVNPRSSRTTRLAVPYINREQLTGVPMVDQQPHHERAGCDSFDMNTKTSLYQQIRAPEKYFEIEGARPARSSSVFCSFEAGNVDTARTGTRCAILWFRLTERGGSSIRPDDVCAAVQSTKFNGRMLHPVKRREAVLSPRAWRLNQCPRARRIPHQ